MRKKKKNCLYVGNAIEFYRGIKHFTINDLSSFSGVSELTIKAIEDNNFNCSIETALRLAIALDISVDKLFRLMINS